MHPSKYVTNVPRQSLDQPSSPSPQHALSAADVAAAELCELADLAKRREATRKYVERVNRYLARADVSRTTFSPTSN